MLWRKDYIFIKANIEDLQFDGRYQFQADVSLEYLKCCDLSKKKIEQSLIIDHLIAFM